MKCHLETNPDGSIRAIDLYLGQKGESVTIRLADDEALALIGFCKALETEKKVEKAEEVRPEKVVCKKTNPDFIFDLIVANGSAKYSRILSDMVKDGRSISRDSLHTTLNKMVREGRLAIVGEKFPADERTYAIRKVDLRGYPRQSKVFDILKDAGHSMTTREISDVLGMDSTESVKNALRFLKNKGLVSKVGTAGYYGVWEVVA